MSEPIDLVVVKLDADTIDITLFDEHDTVPWNPMGDAMREVDERCSAKEPVR